MPFFLRLHQIDGSECSVRQHELCFVVFPPTGQVSFRGQLTPIEILIPSKSHHLVTFTLPINKSLLTVWPSNAGPYSLWISAEILWLAQKNGGYQWLGRVFPLSPFSPVLQIPAHIWSVCIYSWGQRSVRPGQPVTLPSPASFCLLQGPLMLKWHICRAPGRASSLLEQQSRRQERRRRRRRRRKNRARASTQDSWKHTPSGPCLNRCSWQRPPTRTHTHTHTHTHTLDRDLSHSDIYIYIYVETHGYCKHR